MEELARHGYRIRTGSVYSRKSRAQQTPNGHQPSFFFLFQAGAGEAPDAVRPAGACEWCAEEVHPKEIGFEQQDFLRRFNGLAAVYSAFRYRLSQMLELPSFLRKLAYSALASLYMGKSGSALFQSVRNSSYDLRAASASRVRT